METTRGKVLSFCTVELDRFFSILERDCPFFRAHVCETRSRLSSNAFRKWIRIPGLGWVCAAWFLRVSGKGYLYDVEG